MYMCFPKFIDTLVQKNDNEAHIFYIYISCLSPLKYRLLSSLVFLVMKDCCKPEIFNSFSSGVVSQKLKKPTNKDRVLK